MSFGKLTWPKDGEKAISIFFAKKIGEKIGIDWNKVDFTPKELAIGMKVELEHGRHDPETDVTGDNPILTAKIAWAHLKERPDYYDMLLKYVER